MIQKETSHKPTVETMINTAAIAMTATGTALLVNNGDIIRGLILVAVGVALEFYKYWGRKHCYW